MKATFKVQGKEYSFDEVSLRTYYKLKNLLLSPQAGDEFLIVEALTGCSSDILKTIKYGDWLVIWDETQLQIGNLTAGTESIRPSVEFRGVKYGLPNIDDMTIGEFADLDMILTGENPESKLADVAAILYRPIISQRGNVIELEPYTITGYRERLELFQDFPLSAIRSANSFFLQYANSSLRNTVESLVKRPEMKELPKEDQGKLQNYLQEGFGGEFSTHWLEKTLLNFKHLQGYKSEKLSTGWLGGLVNQNKRGLTLKERVMEYVKTRRSKKNKTTK